jgi:undecaprenyl-diphosphatase
MEAHRWTRWAVVLGRRFAPQARFLWNRLTPGNLGLELTAPIAALAVGSFVFVSYAIIFNDDPGPTAADTAAIDIVESLRTAWLTSLEKVLTALGAGVTLSVVAAVGAVAFVLRRHYSEAAILVASAIFLLIGVHEFKELIGRPRPADGLVETDGFAYPSGHAAYSVVYAWLAMAMTLRLRPRWSGGTALLIGGVLLTATIGLSRVYLGAHYLSDVTGGWGLGVCAFAIMTVMSVIVVHIRQNRRDVP